MGLLDRGKRTSRRITRSKEDAKKSSRSMFLLRLMLTDKTCNDYNDSVNKYKETENI